MSNQGVSHGAVAVSETAGVLTITLNRPERRNALTPEMLDELTGVLVEASTSPRTRVVVLTGAGSAFCSGLDLAVLQAMRKMDSAKLDADAQRVSRMFRTLFELPQPTIAAVNGHAIAGGSGLALFTDFTYAVPDAKFGFTECRIGFVPAVVSAYLRMHVSEKCARDLLLSARLFTAAEAANMGLVNEVVAPEMLAARVQQCAAALISNSPESIRATKRLLARQSSAWLDEALKHAMAANAHARETQDFQEGVAAFLEKRHPNWNVE